MERNVKIIIAVIAGIVILGCCGTMAILGSVRNNLPAPNQENTQENNQAPLNNSAGQGRVDESPKEWKLVKTFEGKAQEGTDEFKIEGSKWKVIYDIEKEESYGWFGIVVGTPGQPAYDLLVHAATEDGESIRHTNGTFYLDIQGSNLKSWKVMIYDYK